MNQKNIGKFIQEQRKKKNLTQIELAEKLGVTNRSVSKWENGKCLPDFSLFEPLCDELDITINELLSGKKIKEEDYRKKLEENILKTIDYNNKKRNKKIIRIIIFLIILIIIYTLYKAFITYFYFSQSPYEEYLFPHGGNIETLNVKGNSKANTVFGEHTEQINIYIPNDFELITDKLKSSFVQDNCDYYAMNLIDRDIADAGILICKDDPDTIEYEEKHINDQLFPYLNKYKLFEKYNIKSTIDLFKYYEEHSNDKQNIFTSSDRIKINYISKKYIETTIGSYKTFYYLENNINGYLVDTSYTSSNYYAAIRFGNNNRSLKYKISFMNNSNQYFNKEIVEEILGSIYR